MFQHVKSPITNHRLTRLILITLGALALGGCASLYVRDFSGPDGSQWHSTSCDRIDTCYVRAGAVCKRGYDIKHLDDATHVSSIGYNHGPGGANATLSNGTWKTMMFICK